MYLVEKQSQVDYSIFQTLLERAAIKPGAKELSISKEEMSNLLYLAEMESQRELLKYAVVKAAGLSNTKAKHFYGISEVKKRKERVEQAFEKASSIRESIEKIARLKDRALLFSLGVDCVSESDTTSESESDNDNPGEPPKEHGHLSLERTMYSVVARDRINIDNHTPLDVYQALDILKACKLNWFELVSQIKKSIVDDTNDLISTVLDDLGHQLESGNVELCENDRKIAEQSRQAFLLMNEAYDDMSDNDSIVSDTDDSENEMWRRGIDDVLSVNGKAMIKKRREAIKGVRDAKRRIMEERFLKRRKSKKVSRILNQCPDIGKEIEQFVQDSGAGADAWRRTGVLTFDGNRKLKKKPTFKHIQQHL
jgi:hypothetical protein